VLKTERHKIIMDMIRQQQNVRVTDLKELFQVSDETIRRDLAALEKEGQLRCVHGGAVYDSFAFDEFNVEVQIRSNVIEKEAICAEAAKLVNDGDSVAIAGSTTTLALGKHLAKKNKLTVITNSIQLANQISMNASNNVIVVGGKLLREQQKMMGQLASHDFKRYRVDKSFFSVTGISVKDGITEYTESECDVLKAIIQISKERILLNDATKYKMTGFCRLTDVTDVNTIVTDWHVDEKFMMPYTDLGIKVLFAKEEE